MKPDTLKMLSNWHSFITSLSEVTDEVSLAQLLKAELSAKGKKRKVVVTRLHSRLSHIRTMRERRELLRRCK
jgi:hypothetical protein